MSESQGSGDFNGSQHDDCDSWSDNGDFEKENEKLEAPSTSAKSSRIKLRVGDQFNSFEDVSKMVARYQAQSNCAFYVRDSVTIERSRKRGVTKPIHSELKYYWLKYCCIHGGKKFRSKATGIRTSSTFQKECPAHFCFNVNEDGAMLKLTTVDINHNHVCSKAKYLTQFGFNFVKKELSIYRRSKFVLSAQGNEQFEIRVDDSRICVTPQSCDCPSYASMMLPCRHIFAVRKQLGYNLFDASICNERWTRQYNHKIQHLFEDKEREDVDIAIPTMTSKIAKYAFLSQNKRFQLAFSVTKEMARLISESTDDVYDERMKLLSDLKKAWIDHREVSVITCPNDFDETAASTSIDSTMEIASLCTVQLSEVENITDNVHEHEQKTNGDKKRKNTEEQSKDDVEASNCRAIEVGDIDLSKIKVPTALKREKRSKTSEKTVIGLYKKNKRISTPDDALAFIKLPMKEKKIVILKWLVDEEVALSAINQGKLIDEKFVETRPDKVSQRIVDDDININIIKKHFTKDAWKRVRQIYEQKKTVLR